MDLEVAFQFPTEMTADLLSNTAGGESARLPTRSSPHMTMQLIHH